MPEFADIIAPLAPPPAPLPIAWIIASVGAVLLLLGLIGLRVLYRRRHQRRALKQLKQAESLLQSNTINARQAMFALASALSQVYPVTAAGQRFSPTVIHEATLSNEWSDFLRTIDAARFAARVPQTQQAVTLLTVAKQWVHRAAC